LRSPVEIFEHQYKAAAGEGAIIELKMRLLADKVPELQKFAHDQRLEDVETLIANHFSNALTAEEKTTLAVCRQLRNKILHCDFHAARQKLEQLGIATQSAEVKKVDIRGLSAEQMIEKIAAVKANTAGAFEYVADSPFEAGGVFAWLIELGAAGGRAVKCFAGAAEIVDKLAMIN
jgi:hypothetical protein